MLHQNIVADLILLELPRFCESFSCLEIYSNTFEPHLEDDRHELALKVVDWPELFCIEDLLLLIKDLERSHGIN